MLFVLHLIVETLDIDQGLQKFFLPSLVYESKEKMISNIYPEFVEMIFKWLNHTLSR